jgi:NAD(P)-dependent dehydrogenase (short-subunit alcohol dehydrogenase family)
MGWLEGDAALVTSGGSGLGLALVQSFVNEGARVAVFDRSEERVDAVVERLGEAVVGIVGDVTTMADNEREVAIAVSAFGKLDVFVGNAGTFDYFADLIGSPADALGRAFDEVFAINVKGYRASRPRPGPGRPRPGWGTVRAASLLGRYPPAEGPFPARRRPRTCWSGRRPEVGPVLLSPWPL